MIINDDTSPVPSALKEVCSADQVSPLGSSHLPPQAGVDQPLVHLLADNLAQRLPLAPPAGPGQLKAGHSQPRQTV